MRTETHTFRLGDAFLWSAAPLGPYAAVFEDEGETGYVYAVEARDGEQSILDALHLYNVDEGSAGQTAVVIFVWSDDGHRVAVWLNGRQGAAFDFAGRRAASRTNFPPLSGGFSRTDDWESVAGELRPPE